MSRLYITATMKHSTWGIDLPVFSFETSDHTGGGYHVYGLHPSSIAALAGKGPQLEKQDRFDVKFNINAKRSTLSLVVNTKRHLPHVEWDSKSGVGVLPLGISTLVPMITGKKSLSGSTKSSSPKSSEGRQSESHRSVSHRSENSRRWFRDVDYDDRDDHRGHDRSREKYEYREDYCEDRCDRYDDRRARGRFRSHSEPRSRR